MKINQIINSFLCKSLMTILFCGMILAGTKVADNVYASTQVIGLINVDNTWVKTNSPYTFTGPVGVNENVTLTIEPGVTVDLNGFQLEIFGTLNAKGDSNKIFFNSGTITFTESSTDWNQETNSGCLIQNSEINSDIVIKDASPKIHGSTCARIKMTGGSPIISNNNITRGIIALSFTKIASPLIFNNTITSGSQYAVVDVEGSGVNAQIIGNKINGVAPSMFSDRARYGISTLSSDCYDNIIWGCSVAGINTLSFCILERNYIHSNEIGIIVPLGKSIIINNNTISDNSIGISVNTVLIFKDSPDSNLTYNNFNNPINIRLESNIASSFEVYAAHNWWGTTDIDLINQTMFDNKNDYHLGKVTFVPFLNEPNSNSMPIVGQIIPEFPFSTLLPLVFIGTLIILVFKKQLGVKF